MSKRRPLTEAQWLESAGPGAMVSYLQQHRLVSRVPGGKRKLRLLALAYVEPVRGFITDPRSVRALEVAGRAADGKAKRAESAEAFREAELAGREVEERVRAAYERRGRHERDDAVPELARLRAACYAASWAALPMNAGRALLIVQMSAAQLQEPPPNPSRPAAQVEARRTVEHAQRLAVLDLFGNPFRPVTLDPRWQTANVLDLARTIYEEKAFDRMPILADALLDAGCDSEEVLGHCRGPGPHFRGCWLVDAILGKA